MASILRIGKSCATVLKSIAVVAGYGLDVEHENLVLVISQLQRLDILRVAPTRLAPQP